MSYLHHILSRPADSLLLNFFNVQMMCPVKDDWIYTVKENLNEVDINLDMETIKTISKHRFGKLVRKSVKKAALIYLNNFKESHSKTENLSNVELSLQKYLNSIQIYPEKAKSIFKFRTRMSEVKGNFKNFYKTYLCPLGCNIEDSQEHLLYCTEIYGYEVNENQYYENIYSNKISKLTKIEEKLVNALKKRNLIIEQNKVMENL